MKFTTVLGLDAKHLDQLKIVWPTWMRHKPAILDNPLVIFYDRHDPGIDALAIRGAIPEHSDVIITSWPPGGVEYGGDPNDKWTRPQRVKMLSGFVHVAAKYVHTDYWLKLDVDTVATGHPNWIDPRWFENNPCIVAQPWGYTKPANQMIELDEWIASGTSAGSQLTQPLNLKPKEGWSRVRHKRIISWCGFFNAEFTRWCSMVAESRCGVGRLPVPSQDGFMWYMARRYNGASSIVRANMKKRGWEHWTTMKNIRKAAERAMA